MAKSVVGLFENQSDAQAARRELDSAGFSGNNLTFVDSASDRLSSGLVGAGIPENDARLYAEGVQHGGALIMLQAIPDAEAQRAAAIIDRHNSVDITDMGSSYRHSSGMQSSGGMQRGGMQTSSSTTTQGSSNMSSGMSQSGSRRGADRTMYEGGEQVIPIIEEQISVGKRAVEGGGVRVNTRVEEVPVNEQVTLREEQVHVERRPANRPLSEADLQSALKEGTIDVREHSEEAVVEKQARVVEEVVINKEAQQRTETIQDTVRRTDVNVEQMPGETRTTGYTETGSTGTTGYSDATTTGTSRTGNAGGQNVVERGASSVENAAERLTGSDLNRDGDVGRRG